MRLSIDNGILMARFGDFESIKMISEAGFDCIDFTHAMAGGNSPLLGDGYREHAEKLRAYMDSLGLVCNQAHAPFQFTYGSLFTTDDPHYCKIVRSIESAAILGAESITVHAIGHKQDADILFDRAYNLDYYRSLLPYCEKFGIKIAVENIFEYDQINHRYVGRLDTPQELSEFVTELNSPYFCACFDTGHASLVGIKPEDFIAQMSADQLQSLHLHDGDYQGDRHTLPYLMRFNWQKIMTELKKIGYKGDLTFEILLYMEFVPRELIPEALRFAEKTGRHLISIFENA